MIQRMERIWKKGERKEREKDFKEDVGPAIRLDTAGINAQKDQERMGRTKGAKESKDNVGDVEKQDILKQTAPIGENEGLLGASMTRARNRIKTTGPLSQQCQSHGQMKKKAYG